MKQILITVDTEIGELGRGYPHGFATFVEGKVDNRAWGVPLIVEMLNHHHMPGEFFVDAYEKGEAAEGQFAKLSREIVEGGHGVQLHTHPAGLFDPKRKYLKDYSVPEQREILQTGIERITKWTGKAPIAHRAGGYGIDIRGLQLLSEAGIKYDASYYHGHVACDLHSDIINAPWRKEGVWEIPVTVFHQIGTRTLLGMKVQEQYRLQKLDFRYGASTEQILEAIDQFPSDAVITLFLHSFNFLSLPYKLRQDDFGSIHAQPYLAKQFAHLLSELQQREECKVVSFKQLKISADLLDTVPTVTIPLPWWRSIRNVYKRTIRGVVQV